MAGTDRRLDLDAVGEGPAIVLVEPQLGENIGAVARAMLNCGLTDLRLVRPRDGWPNPQAWASASGANGVLESARLFDSAAEAVADLQWVYATTARPRDMVKPVMTPRQAGPGMRQQAARGEALGVLFGPERTGLSNDDVVLAQTILAVPLNPSFSSLNLAQAVLLIAYEWLLAGQEETEIELPTAGSRPATVAEVDNFFRHLEGDLIAGGFLRPPEKRPIMVRNLRNIFRRACLTDQEVRTLHGMVRALSGRPNRGSEDDEPPEPRP